MHSFFVSVYAWNYISFVRELTSFVFKLSIVGVGLCRFAMSDAVLWDIFPKNNCLCYIEPCINVISADTPRHLGGGTKKSLVGGGILNVHF